MFPHLSVQPIPALVALAYIPVCRPTSPIRNKLEFLTEDVRPKSWHTLSGIVLSAILHLLIFPVRNPHLSGLHAMDERFDLVHAAATSFFRTHVADRLDSTSTAAIGQTAALYIIAVCTSLSLTLPSFPAFMFCHPPVGIRLGTFETVLELDPIRQTNAIPRRDHIYGYTRAKTETRV